MLVYYIVSKWRFPWTEGASHLFRHILRRRNQSAGPISPRLVGGTCCGAHDDCSIEEDGEGYGL